MEQSFFVLALTAFGAGVLTSLTPCVYPMIPISLGYLGSQAGTGRKTKVILFFTGQVLAFTALGVAAVSLGEVFGFANDARWVNISVGALLIFFGFISLSNRLPELMSRWNNIQGRFPLAESAKASWLAPFLIGAGSALVASPCTSPILGTVLVTLSQEATFWQGVMLMAFFATGACLLFLVLGLGLMQVQKLPKSGNWLNHVHKVSSVLILAAGVYYLYLAL